MSPTYELIAGDCRDVLPRLPTGLAHCCVTSPPYWALRDYDVDGQIGLEDNPLDWLEIMVEVFREVRRVLRPDGTLWLNIGDSYAGSGKGRGGSFMKERRNSSWKGKATINGWRPPPAGFKRKDLLGLAWRTALALQDDGWTLRSDIVWEKPNAMPEAVRDRPTKTHEYLFLLSPSDLYYYDSDAIREPVTGGAHTRGGGVGGKTVPPGKGPRSVWTIPTQQYEGDHHATFPEDLVRPCILAGTSAHGCCSGCGAPYTRRVHVEGPTFQERTEGREASKYAKASRGNPHSFAVRGSHGHVSRVRTTVGWDPGCSCALEVEPCVVLDPFAGAGTTGVVAITHGRSFVGVELNPGYLAQADARIGDTLERCGYARAEDLDVGGQLGLLAHTATE